jgi:hypothetical protein
MSNIKLPYVKIINPSRRARLSLIHSFPVGYFW